jgi:signal transduction histidine kinase
MVPNTAIAFLLITASHLFLLRSEKSTRCKFYGQLLALICIILSSITLISYLSGIPEHLLPKEVPLIPGQFNPLLLVSSPHTSVSFFLSSIVLILFSTNNLILRYIGQWIIIGIALLSSVVLIGYLNGQNSLYVYKNIIGMSIITALCFFILVTAILFSRPGEGLMTMLTGSSIGAKVVRRLLPATIIIPVMLGWLILVGQKHNLYSVEFGIALLLVLSLPILISVIVSVARALNREQQLRNAAEHELRLSEARLHKFTEYLQNAREKERISVARDIHDEVGGMLAALKMDIHLLSSKIEKTSIDQTIHARLNKTMQHTDLLMQTVRKIITDLRPSILDILGLIDAIGWQLAEIFHRYGIQYNLDRFISNEQLKFRNTDNLASIFRIFQEVTTNILRHARADLVTVMTTIIQQNFVLSVSDNGCGFDPEIAPRANTFGILGIHERVYNMNGKLTILSKNNIGTTIIINILLKNPNHISDFANHLDLLEA